MVIYSGGMKLLTRAFYTRPADVVARELLGQYLVSGDRKLKITETEAYLGPYDLGSHSRFGKTEHNAVMFGPAGHAYIYLVYGMYHCLNIVTKDDGAAVLIRSAGDISGPGRLCRDLNITRELNGLDMTEFGPLYVSESEGSDPGEIEVTARIGIGYAKDWKDKPLRFVLR